MIILTKATSQKIKEARLKLNLTQQEVSSYLNISFSSYNRIENNISKKIDENILAKLSELLKLDFNIKQNQLSNKKNLSVRIPVDLYEKLKYFQYENKFATMSDTVLYCLNDYTTNVEIAKIKFDLQDFFEELILNTFAKELNSLNIEKNKYKHLLQFLEEKYSINCNNEQEELDQTDLKRKYAKTY